MHPSLTPLVVQVSCAAATGLRLLACACSFLAADCRAGADSLRAACSMIPHPEKVDRGGEDGYFISADGSAFGATRALGRSQPQPASHC